MSVDSGNYWLTDVGDCGGPRGNEVGVVGFAERQIFHFFDIGSGCRVLRLLEKIFICTYVCIIPAKAFSLPVSTIAPVLSSLSSFCRASFSSWNRTDESAFKALGRFSVTN